MCPLARSFNALYQNEDRLASQPLLPLENLDDIDGSEDIPLEESFATNASTAQTRGRTFSFSNRVQEYYAENPVDLNRIDKAACVFSGLSSMASLATFSLHCIEKYRENHNAILRVHILANALSICQFFHSLCYYPNLFIRSLKHILQSNSAPEQRLVLRRSPPIEEHSTFCFWPVVQAYGRLDQNNYCLYTLLSVGSLLSTMLSSTLHFIEKNHEHRTSMLWLEGVQLFCNLVLTTHNVIKVIVIPKWGQPRSVPLHSHIPNHQIV